MHSPLSERLRLTATLLCVPRHHHRRQSDSRDRVIGKI
ncbi:Uncharacterised protein [Shigella sonnei]|nr:Uncharacterised protein [Shigella sonnei]